MSPIQFLKQIKELSETLESWNRASKIMIIEHRDRDGISAITILNQGLKRLWFQKIIPNFLLFQKLLFRIKNGVNLWNLRKLII